MIPLSLLCHFVLNYNKTALQVASYAHIRAALMSCSSKASSNTALLLDSPFPALVSSLFTFVRQLAGTVMHEFGNNSSSERVV